MHDQAASARRSPIRSPPLKYQRSGLLSALPLSYDKALSGDQPPPVIDGRPRADPAHPVRRDCIGGIGGDRRSPSLVAHAGGPPAPPPPSLPCPPHGPYFSPGGLLSRDGLRRRPGRQSGAWPPSL